MENNQVFYDMVAEEIDGDSMNRGLYTKAFAEADGDDKKAKAIYIKMRVKQLELEYNVRVFNEKAKIRAELRANLAKDSEDNALSSPNSPEYLDYEITTRTRPEPTLAELWVGIIFLVGVVLVFWLVIAANLGE